VHLPGDPISPLLMRFQVILFMVPSALHGDGMIINDKIDMFYPVIVAVIQSICKCARSLTEYSPDVAHGYSKPGNGCVVQRVMLCDDSAQCWR
jgi:hypothetical protein